MSLTAQLVCFRRQGVRFVCMARAGNPTLLPGDLDTQCSPLLDGNLGLVPVSKRRRSLADAAAAENALAHVEPESAVRRVTLNGDCVGRTDGRGIDRELRRQALDIQVDCSRGFRRGGIRCLWKLGRLDTTRQPKRHPARHQRSNSACEMPKLASM